MKVGVVFPVDIGTDPAVIKEFAETAETLGYHHIGIADHVLGAPLDHPDLAAPHGYDVPFHEPLVTIGHLAAVTNRVKLITMIVVVPRRQAVLVAKQAAQADIVSDGRLRLGVGVGANRFEYEAMGMDFSNRGDRIEEQITVMRDLWENRLVDFDGHYHTISNAGLNPRPIQRPIPIWIGGGRSDRVLRRIAREADGWLIPQGQLSYAEIKQKRDFVYDHMKRIGRNPAELSLQLDVYPDPDAVDDWLDEIRRWQDFGVTHLSIKTWDIGWEGSELVDAIRDTKQIIDSRLDLQSP